MDPFHNPSGAPPPDYFPPTYILPPVRVLFDRRGGSHRYRSNLGYQGEHHHFDYSSLPGGDQHLNASQALGPIVAMNNYDGGGDGSGPSRPRLNVHLAVPPAQTGADGGHTPNTPEILNSIVNMTQGPFTGFVPQLPSLQDHQVLQQQQLAVPCLGVEQPAGENNQTSTFITLSSPSGPTTLGSSSSLISPCSDSRGSFASAPLMSEEEQHQQIPSPMHTVEHYRSQFIKEGLKMKVKQKMGEASKVKKILPAATPSPTVSSRSFSPMSSLDPSSPRSIDEVGSEDIKVKTEEELLLQQQQFEEGGLTPDDEVKRNRRRERNKVAATKCRNKKKQKTQLLLKESDVLENQNVTLKQEIAKLEKQKKHLVGILSGHEGSCAIKKPRLMSSSPPPPGGDQDPPPFRVPLPPIVVSQDPSGGNPPSSSSSNQQQQQQSLSRFDPGFNEQQQYQQQQQQLDIKSELESPTDPTSNNASGWTSCGFDQQQQLQQQQQQLLQQQQGGNGDRDDQSDNFLAKRSLGYTYLDLDSRCIAL